MALFVTILATVVVAWILLVLLAAVLQRRLIYLPVTSEVPPASIFFPDAEEVTLATDDGLRLGAWFVPSRSVDDAPVAIVFNGNAGDRSFRAPLAASLVEAGISVLLFDYRGYGGNTGRPSERGLIADGRAARDYLVEVRELALERIVYYGESLGTAVAVAVAAERSPAALVLRSPFSSLVSLGRRHYPFLPVGALLRDRFASLLPMARVSCPVLVLAGERDAIVPPRESRKLFAAAPEPKRLVWIEGADHNDADLLNGERLIAEVVGFVREATAHPPRTPENPGRAG